MALYEGVAQGMSREIERWRAPRENAEHFRLTLVLQAMTANYALQYENRFLMIDFVNIMRRIPEIPAHFRAVFLLRKEQFLRELLLLRAEGYLRDDLAEADYENLVQNPSLRPAGLRYARSLSYPTRTREEYARKRGTFSPQRIKPSDPASRQ
jgi:hypothetical protein